MLFFYFNNIKYILILFFSIIFPQNNFIVEKDTQGNIELLNAIEEYNRLATKYPQEKNRILCGFWHFATRSVWCIYFHFHLDFGGTDWYGQGKIILGATEIF